MTIIQASFFWKNDKPCGIGLTFGPRHYTPEELQAMFAGEDLKDYMRDSDLALGTNVVNDYLAQLATIGKKKGMLRQEPSLQEGILAALNIIWLTDRGFIPNDEFNGYQFIRKI